MRAYRSLLAGAAARRLALASVLGWLGFGALSLGIVLTVQHASGSPSTAGLALAGFARRDELVLYADPDRFGPLALS